MSGYWLKRAISHDFKVSQFTVTSERTYLRVHQGIIAIITTATIETEIPRKVASLQHLANSSCKPVPNKVSSQ